MERTQPAWMITIIMIVIASWIIYKYLVQPHGLSINTWFQGTLRSGATSASYMPSS